ncbi:MAG TPA: Cof-type HAD-IIB family hydrolase, partial [Limnochordia bacterium]
DLDGTLLNSAKAISPRNAAAVRRAQAAGARVVIATARPPRSARPFLAQLGLSGPGIFYNGALVCAADGSEVIDHQPIPLPLAREFLEQCLLPPRSQTGSSIPIAGPVPRGLPKNIVVEVADRYYAWRLDGQIVRLIQRGGAPPAGVGELPALIREPVSKISVCTRHPRRLAKIALEWSKGRLACVRSDRRAPWLEFLRAGVSKAAAVERLARQWGIGWDAIAAFGDEENDVELLRFAGFGVAMGNAPAPVRRTARHVTATNDEDGVAEVLERLFD